MSAGVDVLAVMNALIRMPSVVVNLDGVQIIRPAIINTRDAVAELIETLGYCEEWFERHSPTAPLINGLGEAEHPMLTSIRAALARVGVAK